MTKKHLTIGSIVHWFDQNSKPLAAIVTGAKDHHVSTLSVFTESGISTKHAEYSAKPKAGHWSEITAHTATSDDSDSALQGFLRAGRILLSR